MTRPWAPAAAWRSSTRRRGQVVGRPVGVYWIFAFILAYVAIAAFYVRRRGRTWIHLTAAGRTALYEEKSQLKRLIRQVKETPAADPASEPS